RAVLVQEIPRLDDTLLSFHVASQVSEGCLATSGSASWLRLYRYRYSRFQVSKFIRAGPPSGSAVSCSQISFIVSVRSPQSEEQATEKNFSHSTLPIDCPPFFGNFVHLDLLLRAQLFIQYSQQTRRQSRVSLLGRHRHLKSLLHWRRLGVGHRSKIGGRPLKHILRLRANGRFVMTKRKAAATAAAAGLSQPTRAKSARTAAANKASTSSKLPPNFEWTQAGGLAKPGVPHMFVLSSSTAVAAKKCAVFDIDWCLIKPKSGGKWPKNASDWCWLFDSVPDKLKQLHSDGYRLLFISNQSGFEKGTTSPKEIMQKCELVISELGVPADVILIGSVSHFRKPDIGAWEFFVRDCNGGVEFDKSSSFFVGDAAGRPASGSHKKDFSCSDRMFAANIGLPFSTPEEFFLDEPKSEFDWGAPSPQSLLDAAASCSLPGVSLLIRIISTLIMSPP
uniref:FHA_2 domain-containing protein n=1 Tax=Macrostomum lignano TaxID=282301 RepID=A0A1I8IHM9_9PLAT